MRNPHEQSKHPLNAQHGPGLYVARVRNGLAHIIYIYIYIYTLDCRKLLYPSRVAFIRPYVPYVKAKDAFDIYVRLVFSTFKKFVM